MIRRRPSRRHLVVVGVVVGDPDAVLELHAGEHVGDELVAVEPPPALLGGVEQLVGHRQRGLLGAGALGDAGAQLDGREAALDRVAWSAGGASARRGSRRTRSGAAQSRSSLATALGYLASNSSRKRSSAARGVGARRGFHDLVQQRLRAGLQALGQRVEDVARSCAPSTPGGARRGTRRAAPPTCPARRRRSRAWARSGRGALRSRITPAHDSVLSR